MGNCRLSNTTKDFPTELRAQGNCVSMTGWAIGVGWTAFVSLNGFGSLVVLNADCLLARVRDQRMLS